MSKEGSKSPEGLRRRAEKQLEGQLQKAAAPKTLADQQRIVHELEVHQIELEMQNEALQQARSKLETVLDQFTDLYDFAPIGYCTLDASGMILQVNLTGALMLGTDRSRLVNQPFIRFITADAQAAFTAFLEKSFNNHSQETAIFEVESEGGGTAFVHFEARVSEQKPECRIALIDVTAQKRAETLLEASEKKYRTLFESLSQGVIHCGQNGTIISANPAAERILGLTFDQMLESSSAKLFIRAIHEDGTIFSDETHPGTVALRIGNAVHNVVMGILSPQETNYIWLNITAVPLPVSGQDRTHQVLVTFEDITLQKRLLVYNTLTTREKEVFKLLVREYERKFIAEYLNISAKTVDKHRENLMEKLNLHEKKELMQFAKLIGLV